MSTENGIRPTPEEHRKELRRTADRNLVGEYYDEKNAFDAQFPDMDSTIKIGDKKAIVRGFHKDPKNPGVFVELEGNTERTFFPLSDIVIPRKYDPEQTS